MSIEGLMEFNYKNNKIKHNKIITSKKYKFGGSSAIISSKKAKGFVLDENKKGKMVSTYVVFSTTNLK